MPRGEFLGSLEQIVMLAVVRLGSDAYGMTVRREIEERTGREISIGAVYATLERLVAKGLARETDVAGGGERSGLARRFYAVTSRGRAALQDARALQTRMWAGLDLKADRRKP